MKKITKVNLSSSFNYSIDITFEDGSTYWLAGPCIRTAPEASKQFIQVYENLLSLLNARKVIG